VDARALPAGYTEWTAPAAVRDAVTCLWAQVTTSGADRAGLVLPDGCTDLVWEQGRGAFVAGPDTGPVPTTMAAGSLMLGIRFRPSAGGPGTAYFMWFQTMLATWSIVSMPYCSVGFPVVSTAIR